ncbi:MAG TPA: hypothetical protein VGR00_06890, partial [Thermoanaerobaculia bacterium]|nr:hypothetical protein [Thermoanaerobaculia bacterium]
KSLSSHLSNVAKKLDSTDGTAGKLIADPAVYDALNDIIVGIDQSKLLKWLIRNRQKSGIKKRYEETRTREGESSAAPESEPTPVPTPKLETP